MQLQREFRQLLQFLNKRQTHILLLLLSKTHKLQQLLIATLIKNGYFVVTLVDQIASQVVDEFYQTDRF